MYLVWGGIENVLVSTLGNFDCLLWVAPCVESTNTCNCQIDPRILCPQDSHASASISYYCIATQLVRD